MSSTFYYRASLYSEERVVGGLEHQDGGVLWGPSLKTSYHRGVSDDGAAWKNQAKGRKAQRFPMVQG